MKPNLSCILAWRIQQDGEFEGKHQKFHSKFKQSYSKQQMLLLQDEIGMPAA